MAAMPTSLLCSSSLEFIKMAFSFNSTASNNNAARPKAAAFLNLWVKRQDGSRAKIGAIPLSSEGFQGAVVKRLAEDDGLEALVNNLEIDFVKVDPNRQYSAGF